MWPAKSPCSVFVLGSYVMSVVHIRFFNFVSPMPSALHCIYYCCDFLQQAYRPVSRIFWSSAVPPDTNYAEICQPSIFSTLHSLCPRAGTSRDDFLSKNITPLSAVGAWVRRWLHNRGRGTSVSCFISPKAYMQFVHRYGEVDYERGLWYLIRSYYSRSAA